MPVRPSSPHTRYTDALAPLDARIDLSVIIVNWNTRDLLRTCLRTLRETTHALRVETIVVDNASHDGSVEMVQGEFPNVLLLVNSRNRGFAVANNCALSRVAAMPQGILWLLPQHRAISDSRPLLSAYLTNAVLRQRLEIVGLQQDFHFSCNAPHG